MVRCINIDEDNILKVIKNRELLNEFQIANLKLIQKTTKENLVEIIIREELIDNELMIDLLHNSNSLPLIDNKSHDIKIYDYSRIKEYIVKGYFVYEDIQNNKIIAINDLRVLSLLANAGNHIYLIKKPDFYKVLEANFAHLNIVKSKYFLEFTSEAVIAKNINYSDKVIIFFLIFLEMLVYFPALFHIANNAGYFLQNFLKILLFSRAVLPDNLPCKVASNQAQISHFNQESKEFPIYTILIPLYKETGKLKSIIKNISLLNYPKNKLDVKIIIEADDYLMIKEIAVYNLPSYIHVLQAPVALPRTKPKALN